ncbi:TRAP transporter small permease [Brevibacillus humidisoli]|uniref:TRAP transporter small permease n=1 Tax=Brevibacillus humidisoli TaxID=2895522 RepID=UPI001E4CD1A1|nr:TRAP transporter small permease [Brevibacillus humidisoli]UFJ39915.1 TRAP transporter small permease [Brevibacillus humidisoli]
MRGVLQSYIHLVDRVNKIFGWGLALIIAVMSILIFWQVMARYAFGSSLAWSEELARFLMIFMVLIGSSLALRKGSLLAVEIVPEVAPARVKKWIKVSTHLISLVFYVIMMIYGWKLAESFAMQEAPGTGLSMFWIYLSLPIGGLLLLLNSLSCILEEFIGTEE